MLYLLQSVGGRYRQRTSGDCQFNLPLVIRSGKFTMNCNGIFRGKEGSH